MNQFEMKQKAYQSNLKSRALQVLLYLIDRSNKEKTCFPAVPTISRELHISISTVKRAMRELVDAGYVQKESRFREGNRGQTSNLYILFFPEAKKSEDCGNEVKSVGDLENVEQKHMVYVKLNTTEKSSVERMTKTEKLNQNGKLKQRTDKNRSMWWFFTKKYQDFLVSLVCHFEIYCTLYIGWPGEGINLIPP